MSWKTQFAIVEEVKPNKVINFNKPLFDEKALLGELSREELLAYYILLRGG